MSEYDKYFGKNKIVEYKLPYPCKKSHKITELRKIGDKRNQYVTSVYYLDTLYGDDEEIEKFLEKPSKNLKEKAETDLCHGILRCQSIKHKSEIFHNIDKNNNVVQNMLKIVKSIFNTGKRPEVFCRSC